MNRIKNLLFLYVLIAVLAIINPLKAQTQKGGDIDGEVANDESGTSVSMPNNYTVAIGAPNNDGTASNAGHVRVYNWNGNNWSKKGNDIDGEAVNNNSGCSVSMPDANTMAIGARFNNGNGIGSGHVRIYKWNGSSWVQKGNDIDGEASGDQSGYAVSMPDSNTVAIGALNNYGGSTFSGHVRIYAWNGGAWIQKGNDIDGEATYDLSGTSVSMPDANTVAIGAPGNDGNGAGSGHVRIYKWNGSTWVQKGNDIDGEASSDESGTSVSMPDSNTVAIGAPQNDENWTKADCGHVRIYSWNGSTWVQKGGDIDGEAAGDFSGFSISMPNANTVAIGSRVNAGNGLSSGHARVYSWIGGTWVKKGIDIDGESGGDQSGTSISMPDINTLAVGARLNDGNGVSAGHVRVHIVCNNTKSISRSSCSGQYTSPSGKYTWTTSGTYKDTIPNVAGCDSIITINLTVRNATSGNITPGGCLSKYISPSGKYTWTTSGTYKDTIPNAAGCDSVITVNLIIKNTTASISHSVCYSYTSPSGKYTWATNGIYKDTITNAVGCDSIISINLTVKNTFKFMNATSCDSYTSPSGKYTWTTSGIYRDTISNVAGCDSIIVVNLTVHKATTGNTNFTSCNSYTSPSGKYTWTASGTYTDTIPNKAGCDSVITVTLTINMVDISVTNSSSLLTANATGATYQWLNCNSSFSVITGETSKSFTATTNGSYAVEITKSGCTDTSLCIAVNNLGLTENSFGSAIHLFPSPTNGEITIELGAIYLNVRTIIRNALGQEIYRKIYPIASNIQLELSGEAGIYSVELTDGDNKRAVLKLIKK